MAHEALVKRLREAGDRLAMFSTHDDKCASYRPHWPEPRVCDCGYTTAINAWKELGS